MAAIVTVTDVHRQFTNVHAVRGISFEIQQGQVVGFIGANGAGKTTTMRMMATLDVPTRGSIRIAGEDAAQHPEKVRRVVGWMPDNYGTYANMTVHEYLDFFARSYGLKGKERAARVQEVMEFADLVPLAERMMNALSKGMAQRLCFGRMLLPDPEFLILDEPAAGLDPKARIEFKNLVRILKERGKTLFISSHILSELGEMCDSLLFINDGQVMYQGGTDDLRKFSGAGGEQARSVVDITVLGDPAALVQWASLNAGWKLVDQKRDGARLELADTDPTLLAAGLRKMVMEGIQVLDFHREERRLEDVFVDLIKKQ
jgi:ABC-2 type transport system ATP-binding protein